MTTKEQVLRQAFNQVEISGIAQESTLELKEFVDKSTNLPYKAIIGDVTVKISEDETQVVSYFVKQLTKDGAENKTFKAMNTIMNEMVTMADVAQGYKSGEPSLITCKGRLELNDYMGRDGELKSFPKITGQFSPTRFKGNVEEFTPKATFDIEGIMKASATEELKDEQPTGRVKIQLYVPMFGGKIIPLSFVTTNKLKSNDVDYLLDNFVKNASVRIHGLLVNKSKKIEREVALGFGESKIETTYERVREYMVIGGSVYEEGNKNEFDVSLLKEAVANRDRYLSTLKAPAQDNKPANNVGFGSGFGASQSQNNTKDDDGLADLFGED